MIHRRLSICLLIASVWLAIAADSTAEFTAAVAPAFAPGERLAYAVSYLGVRAGSLTMEVAGRDVRDGRPVYRLTTSATSQDPITRFFPVDDHAETIVDAETLAPQRVRVRKHEGKARGDIDVTFRHGDGTALAVKDGEATTLQIPLDTQQTFSVLYYVRSLRALTLGSSWTLTVQHETKHYPMHLVVDKLEEIAGPNGRVSALRVNVTFPNSRLWRKPGHMQVWVTNDARHLPLRAVVKLRVGSLIADLVDPTQIIF